VKKPSYIIAIRPLNLLISLLILLAVRIRLTPYFGGFHSAEIMPWSLYSISVLCIMAFGYLINDYYDVATDRINKPGQNIFDRAKTTLPFIYLLIFLGAGLFIPLFLGIMRADIFTFSAFGLNALVAFKLFLYARHAKSSLLFGNVLIALLAAALVFAPLIAGVGIQLAFEHAGMVLWMYAGFSFLVTLSREIIKDAEDVEGDRNAGILTLSTFAGTDKAQKINLFILLICLLLLPVLGLYFIGNEEIRRGISCFVLEGFGIFVMFKSISAREKAGFSSLSGYLKIWMALGILSMWL